MCPNKNAVASQITLMKWFRSILASQRVRVPLHTAASIMKYCRARAAVFQMIANIKNVLVANRRETRNSGTDSKGDRKVGP